MNYDNGNRIEVGDEVLYAGKQGRVVFIIEEGAAVPGYNIEDWAYLGRGIGVELTDGTLYRLDVPDEDLLRAE